MWAGITVTGGAQSGTLWGTWLLGPLHLTLWAETWWAVCPHDAGLWVSPLQHRQLKHHLESKKKPNHKKIQPKMFCKIDNACNMNFWTHEGFGKDCHNIFMKYFHEFCFYHSLTVSCREQSLCLSKPNCSLCQCDSICWPHTCFSSPCSQGKFILWLDKRLSLWQQGNQTACSSASFFTKLPQLNLEMETVSCTFSYQLEYVHVYVIQRNSRWGK